MQFYFIINISYKNILLVIFNEFLMRFVLFKDVICNSVVMTQKNILTKFLSNTNVVVFDKNDKSCNKISVSNYSTPK